MTKSCEQSKNLTYEIPKTKVFQPLIMQWNPALRPLFFGPAEQPYIFLSKNPVGGLPGALFSNVPIIIRFGKLSLFKFKIEVSIVS